MERGLRFAESAGCILLLAVMALCAWTGTERTAVIAAAAALPALVPFIVRAEKKMLRARDVTVPVVLTALACAGRVLFASIPNFMPTSAIIIMGALVFGADCGLLCGMLTGLVSNLLLGLGPYVPWQMLAWGLMGLAAGRLGEKTCGKIGTVPVCLFAFIASVLYGVMLDGYHVLSFIRPLTLQTAAAGFVSGMLFNLVHAFSSVIFTLLGWPLWQKRLLRIRQKFELLH